MTWEIYLVLCFRNWVSPGQLWPWQFLVSVGNPVHWLPPFVACCAFVLVRRWLPAPHVTLHLLHCPQVFQEQSTGIKILTWEIYLMLGFGKRILPGQFWVLQFLVSRDDPLHWLPPFAACCAFVLVRPWLPVPHVTLHVLHCPHSFQEQSTGIKILLV